jgi:hypothetical protein
MGTGSGIVVRRSWSYHKISGACPRFRVASQNQNAVAEYKRDDRLARF